MRKSPLTEKQIVAIPVERERGASAAEVRGGGLPAPRE